MPVKRKFTLSSASTTNSVLAGELPSPAKARAAPAKPKAGSPANLLAVGQEHWGRAPVVVCIYKVTDSASDVWSSITDESAALFQIQVVHSARPSVTYNMVVSFNEFLKEAHTEDGEIPKTVPDLSRQAGIRIVVTSPDDPEGLGCFVRWRTGFYVAGSEVSLQNFLYLLDRFFIWKEKKMARERPFTVRLHPHAGISISTDGLGYGHYTLNDPAKSLPLRFFECHPCTSKRAITLNVEAISEHMVSIVVSGNSYAYRRRLDVLKVRGGYHTTESGAQQYVRALTDVNVTVDAERSKVFKMIGSSVFRNLAMRLVVLCEPPAYSAVFDFITELRGLPCLHQI